jgi:hypothetical protein
VSGDELIGVGIHASIRNSEALPECFEILVGQITIRSSHDKENHLLVGDATDRDGVFAANPVPSGREMTQCANFDQRKYVATTG